MILLLDIAYQVPQKYISLLIMVLEHGYLIQL